MSFFVQLHKKGNFLFGSNISTSLHTWAGQVKRGCPASHRQIQRANAVVRYGRDEGPGRELLLPVTVEHDRSRHAERRALVSLIALCAPKKEVVDAVDLKTWSGRVPQCGQVSESQDGNEIVWGESK